MLRQCPICGADRTYELPVPAANGALLSDGRVLPHALAKAGCLVCGAAFHVRPPEDDEVAAFFDDGYALPALAAAGDRARTAAYARWLSAALGDLRGARVLELGAGSGGFLEQFCDHYPGASGLGLEPAAAAQFVQRSAAVSIRRGRIDNLKASEGRFDLVVAINVVEHVTDGVAFLESIAPRLSEGGRVAIVCPDGAIPNDELLFFDHLTSFTVNAFIRMANSAGFRVVMHQRSSREIGDFQLFVLSRQAGAPSVALPVPPANLAPQRRHYLSAWQGLDAELSRRTDGGDVILFGAGQAAAMLRAYAPTLWRRVSVLLLDDPSEAWALGRPVCRYADHRGADIPIVVAVAPGRQGPVRDRLAKDGLRPVIWDDLLADLGS